MGDGDGHAISHSSDVGSVLRAGAGKGRAYPAASFSTYADSDPAVTIEKCVIAKINKRTHELELYSPHTADGEEILAVGDLVDYGSSKYRVYQWYIRRVRRRFRNKIYIQYDAVPAQRV